MKNVITKVLSAMNLVIWFVIGICCIIALVVFAREFIQSISAGEEIFLPGIIILCLVVLALLFFSVTRAIKYISRIK